MVILTSSGITTEYLWRCRGIIGEIEWDCPGETTRESLLASVERHARSVTTGNADYDRMRATERRRDDDDDDHNLVITSSLIDLKLAW